MDLLDFEPSGTCTSSGSADLQKMKSSYANSLLDLRKENAKLRDENITFSNKIIELGHVNKHLIVTNNRTSDQIKSIEKR